MPPIFSRTSLPHNLGVLGAKDGPELDAADSSPACAPRPANAWWGSPLALSAKPEIQSQCPPHSANRNTISFGKHPPPRPESCQRRVICPWAGTAAALSPSLRGISKPARIHVHSRFPGFRLELSPQQNRNLFALYPTCLQTGPEHRPSPNTERPRHRSRHTTLVGSHHLLDRTCIGAGLVSIDLNSDSSPSRSPAIHTDAANTQYERGQPLSYRHPVL